MSSYNKVVKGKLSFKGGKSTGSVKKRPAGESGPRVGTGSQGGAPSTSTVRDVPVVEEELQIMNGTGRFTTSGVTVHGHGTKFMEEVGVGDAVIVTHPSTLVEETKIVRMVLSNISMGISSAFSSDLVSQTAFRYVNAPKEQDSETLAAAERSEVQQRKRKADEVEEGAFGTYASAGGEKAVYRVKKPGAHGGYTIITESGTRDGKPMSREDLLTLRSKKKADRHCY